MDTLSPDQLSLFLLSRKPIQLNSSYDAASGYFTCPFFSLQSPQCIAQKKLRIALCIAYSEKYIVESAYAKSNMNSEYSLNSASYTVKMHSL